MNLDIHMRVPVLWLIPTAITFAIFWFASWRMSKASSGGGSIFAPIGDALVGLVYLGGALIASLIVWLIYVICIWNFA